MQIFTEIGQSATELWPKTSLEAVRHLEFKNKIHVTVIDFHMY